MKLPKYVENKPESVQKEWSSIYNQYATEGEAIGLGVANKWLESYQPTVVDNLVFSAGSEQVVARSIDGVEYFDFLLTDNKLDSYGTKYKNEFLEKLSKYINENPQKLAEADFNHDTLNKLLNDGSTMNSIKTNLKGLKKGVAKVVKAIYEKGKLFIRTVIDPNYRERILKAKGVSIEGSFVREGDTFVDGTILGLSIIDDPNKDLGNPRAKKLN